MDCKFINQNDIHERYLLDRLDETEKSEYLTHLNSCDSCKSKMNSEKETQDSIRHFGKSEMKSEIAKQVSELKKKEKSISWDMILKVAAIFFFLVITPALVFYYQSIEIPKISEMTDFDNLLNKEIVKENEIIKGEKVEYKIEEISDSKGKKNENISDIIKTEEYGNSAAGAAAERASKSISISNSVAKSPQIDEDINIIDKSEVNAPQAIEQPFASVPQSKIPSLKNFQKPVKVTLTDNALDVSGDMKNRRMTTASYSNISDKTQDEPYTEDEITIAGKEKSGQISKKKLSENRIDILDFILNNKKITVNLMPLDNEPETYLQESFPDSFQVIKKKNENVDLIMDWFFNSPNRKIIPKNISLYLTEKDLLYVNILNEIFYKIDLQSDTTVAKLIQ
jgi:hypothetical protein